MLACPTARSLNGIAGDYDALSGDYFHKNVPYDAIGRPPSTTARTRLPNTSATAAFSHATGGFNVQMTNWCSQCHTRYLAASGARSPQIPPPAAQTGGGVDSIFSYRHTTAQNRTCTTCHVAHGTNAVMQSGARARLSGKRPVPGQLHHGRR